MPKPQARWKATEDTRTHKEKNSDSSYEPSKRKGKLSPFMDTSVPSSEAKCSSVHRLSRALLIKDSPRNTGCPLLFCPRASCTVFCHEFESEPTSPPCHPVSLAHLSPPSSTALDHVRAKVARLGDVSTTGTRAHNGPFLQM